MKSETSRGTDIVPCAGGIVNVIPSNLMGDLPFRLSGLSVSIVSVPTHLQCLAAFDCLFSFTRKAAVRVNFAIGDIWNFMHEDANRRLLRQFNLALDEKSDELATLIRKRLRQCGWVASKWPPEQRTDAHGWSYYVGGKKGEAAKKPEDGLPYNVAVRFVKYDNGGWYECAGVGDKRSLVRIPESMLDALMLVHAERHALSSDRQFEEED